MNQEDSADRRGTRGEAQAPATAYAILGLLSFGERSGYDLARFAERSIGYFFSPAKSHIYSELRRLVALGWADERLVRQRQRPDKRLYRMTPEGERALRAWLASPHVEPDTTKSQFTLRLFFGHLTDPEILIARVHQYREACRARLNEYRRLERSIAGAKEMRFPYLTLKSGLAHTRASIRWADEVLQVLEDA